MSGTIFMKNWDKYHFVLMSLVGIGMRLLTTLLNNLV